LALLSFSGILICYLPCSSFSVESDIKTALISPKIER
jgi:hypothetical protein